MRKVTTRIIAYFLIMLVLVTTLSGCAVKPEPEYAGSIIEDILVSMKENDYTRFSERLEPAWKMVLPENRFVQMRTRIKAEIGDYLPGSKEFRKVKKEGIYTLVYYKAKFTEEPSGVMVKVSFQEIEEGMYVAGLWFDS